MVQYYCAGVSGISQAQEVYRQTMSGVDMVPDPFGSHDTLNLCSRIHLDMMVDTDTLDLDLMTL